MRKSLQWFEKNTQQVVMARVSTLPVLARVGTTNKSGNKSTTQYKDQEVFIVGESEVGGSHRVGGTP